MSDIPALKIVPGDIADLSTLTDEQLLQEIRDGIEMSARGIERAARAIVELERRGRDLSEFRRQTVHFLSLVAYKQLLPEVYLQFMGNGPWLRVIAQLPIPDQEKIASGKSLPMVVAGTGPTKWTTILVNPRDVQPAKIRQLIGPDGIRDEGEQIAWLESTAEATTKRKDRRKLGPIAIDRTAGILKVGQSKLTPAMVVNALSQLNGRPEPGGDTPRRLTVKLTEDEYRNLSIHAAADGAEPSDLARQAIALFGLMRKPAAV